jgi:hypothetical protein
MDMLEVGRGFTDEEDQTHFAVWCMMSSPLLIGCDLEKLKSKPKTLALLKNTDLIALNQDTAAPQAYVVRRMDDAYVLVRDIEKPFGTKRAVAFVNLGDKPCEMSISAREIDLAGIDRTRSVTPSNGEVAEWFPQEDGRRINMGAIPAHGTRVCLVETAKRLERELYEAETAFLPTYQELHDAKHAKTAFYEKNDKASGGMVVSGAGGRTGNGIVWERVWSEKGGNYAMTVKTLGDGGAVMARVNGTVVSGTAKEGAGLEFSVTLRPGLNEVCLFNDFETLPAIDVMTLERKGQ